MDQSVGVQLGQKLGQYLDSNHLKSLFALLLCSVAIAIAYDSFFRDKTSFNETQVIKSDLNSLAEFSLKFNNEAPFLYGALAIILAISLGAFTAWMRKIVSDLRKVKPKVEEVNFLQNKVTFFHTFVLRVLLLEHLLEDLQHRLFCAELNEYDSAL